MGIIIFFAAEGPEFGVQFSTLVHESDTEPFHVIVETVLNSSRVKFLALSKLAGKKATLTFERLTQFSSEFIAERPYSNPRYLVQKDK